MLSEEEKVPMVDVGGSVEGYQNRHKAGLFGAA